MTLPYFYISSFDRNAPEVLLDEDNSRHIVQVLRMKPGEGLYLTDGKGSLITAAIKDANKKKCLVAVKTVDLLPPPQRNVAVAISPVKNVSRFEWFLEKATEIGVSGIIPLITDRTERQHLRADRLQNILVSAMLQSRQAWMPALWPATAFSDAIDAMDFERRLIAWLGDPQKAVYPRPDLRSTVVLIGPEGDFTAEEAAAALDRRYVPVTLGSNRLRTETAGIVAASLLCIGEGPEPV